MRLWITSLFCILVVAACTTSPTGRRQLLLYDNAEVSKLGLASFDEIKNKEKIVSDPRLVGYVTCVARAVTQQIPSSYGLAATQQWEVVVFDSDQANAFALPGGRIGVYTGLLKPARTPGQLAAVIGHEVAHVLAHHSNERLSNAQVANLGMVAADMALGSSSTKAPAMAALGLGVQVGYLLPYGRVQESEADELGLQLMANAGFDPREAITLWQNMSGMGARNQPPELLSTHPADARRIHDLQARLPGVQGLYQQARGAGRNPQCRR